jgi:hypothetical protein
MIGASDPENIGCFLTAKSLARHSRNRNELTTKIAKKMVCGFALHDFAFPLCVLCDLCG